MTERPTWLIVGLGNPGPRYAATRHNIGFMVVDELARRFPPGETRRRFDSELIETTGPRGRVVLLKPQTYMNLSGNAVAPTARWYRVPLDRILIIYDDLDLPFGRIRLRPGGSSAGHNGLASVLQMLGTERVPRLRVGIGRPANGNTVGYVLSRFRPEEERRLPDIIALAADAALAWYQDGIDAAMNMYNRVGAQPAEGRDAPRGADARRSPTGT
ncbi:MAG: aminoacyl-tRNA hydrolase [Sphaerobacter sp.]|nr:aminoacyl-tRNA hydrolase [Sphaerobacter sp.]